MRRRPATDTHFSTVRHIVLSHASGAYAKPPSFALASRILSFSLDRFANFPAQFDNTPVRSSVHT